MTRGGTATRTPERAAVEELGRLVLAARAAETAALDPLQPEAPDRP